MIITFIIMTALLSEAYAPNITISKKSNTKVCGLDRSPIKVVYEGEAKIETYPWLGTLFYTTRGFYFYAYASDGKWLLSSMDIYNIRRVEEALSRARVVLGHNCSRPGIKIKDYSFHPEFSKETYSALVLIQLETNFRSEDLRPVCAPPKHLKQPQFYALALSDDCNNSKVKIYKMTYVSPEQCQGFYRRTELDMKKMWPTRTICARALTGKECIWKNGAMLLLRQKNIWSLIGVGVHGPGCRAPARFLDYAHHKPWLTKSVLRIGRPTVTRVSNNKIILRRKLSNVQRFGPCDPEETKEELFSDRTTVVKFPTTKYQHVSYNFTVFANLEYSCVIFQVFHFYEPDVIRETPYIHLKRWCMSPEAICYSFQFLEIEFGVEIWFRESITYHVAAYGTEVKLVDMGKLMARVNERKPLVQIEKR